MEIPPICLYVNSSKDYLFLYLLKAYSPVNLTGSPRGFSLVQNLHKSNNKYKLQRNTATNIKYISPKYHFMKICKNQKSTNIISKQKIYPVRNIDIYMYIFLRRVCVCMHVCVVCMCACVRVCVCVALIWCALVNKDSLINVSYSEYIYDR